jgi:hypothetical protein
MRSPLSVALRRKCGLLVRSYRSLWIASPGLQCDHSLDIVLWRKCGLLVRSYRLTYLLLSQFNKSEEEEKSKRASPSASNSGEGKP